MIEGRLDMATDEVGSRFGNGLDVTVRFVEHQVNIKKERRWRAKRGHGLRTEAQIGDEVPIHDVEMKPLDSELFDNFSAAGEIGMVSGENRRGEDGRIVHDATMETETIKWK